MFMMTQKMQTFELPIFLLVGLGGFIMTCAADIIRNRYKKQVIEASAHTKADESQPVLPSNPKDLCLSLNIAGLIMLLASLAALFVKGYFDAYIHMLLG